MYQVAFRVWDPSPVQSFIDSLPESILLKIFKYFSLMKDLVHSAMVCQRWRRVAYDSSLWRHVDLSGRTLTERSLTLIDRISQSVTTIIMNGSVINASIISEITQKCVKLKTLSLLGAHFTDHKTDFKISNPCFQDLQTFDLRFLYGDHTKIFTKILKELKNIHCLGIDNVSSSAELERILSSLHNLTIVHCQNCVVFNDTHVTTLADCCPNLESLCLTGSIYVTGSSFPKLMSKCRGLKTLLVSCTRIRNVYFLLTDWSQSSLTELDISYCYGISESGLREMLPYLTQLRYLQASFCGWGRALTNSVINAMAYTEYLRLETLDLHSSFNISGYALCNLARNCPALTTLCVGSAVSSTEELEELLRSIRDLKHFYITKQATVKTETVVRYVKKFCPKIETLALYNFYAGNRFRVEQALIELVAFCRSLKTLSIRGTNVPLRAELTDLANKVKKISKRNDIEISREPHLLVSGATLCLDNIVQCSQIVK